MITTPKSGLRRALFRVIGPLLFLLIALAGHDDLRLIAFADPEGGYDVAVVEHLRIQVPEQARDAWMEAERGSWEPWLAQQKGFLGRDLLWDPSTEEGTLLIRWSSREAWKAIPQEEVEAVQQRFELIALQALGQDQGNPFPLVYEGELLTQ
ncbi:antibiotic biosynthesis monooxygenase-like domain containing protein [Synechococcus sp. PROS-7-1]|uniref:TIGR03792 family protein n=1 Tax=Synechococcus sp. PROS-7-1 TaxID=1442556 RepID=UPI001644BC3F|nr:TIGR03792 family protein [Synechococcus sp. PROS-7-1]QNI85740.1 antibiotic biosynthesis monooxygenase-like domain containing protein [Synechococcus sp. PROS-7-1]